MPLRLQASHHLKANARRMKSGMALHLHQKESGHQAERTEVCCIHAHTGRGQGQKGLHGSLHCHFASPPWIGLTGTCPIQGLWYRSNQLLKGCFICKEEGFAHRTN